MLYAARTTANGRRAVSLLWMDSCVGGQKMTKTTMRKKIQAKTWTDEMRPNEAAEYVGISRAYFYALLSSEVIPSKYTRGKRLIRREDLDRFIEQRTTATK